MFMLLKPMDGDATPPSPMTPGHVGWHELHARDGASAFEFYAGQFGWTKDRSLEMGPMGTYQLFATGGEAVGGGTVHDMQRTPRFPRSHRPPG